MKKIKLIKYLTLPLIMLISVFAGLFTGMDNQSVKAESSEYSDVLADLQKDKDFNADKYQWVPDDYSLEVIQIAESVNKELFVYVYQPSFQMGIRASSINISRQGNNTNELKFQNYKLTYINSYGVLFKYKVDNFTVGGSSIRYYNISSILRPFYHLVDEPLKNGVTVSEVPYEVGQIWTVQTVNGEIEYSMTTSETITITEKYVGYVEYSDGVNVGWAVTESQTMAHFVAFDTDKQIDKLLEADVTFTEQAVNCKYCGNVMHINHGYKSRFDYEYGEVVEREPLTLTFRDLGTNNKGDKTWYRIRSTDEFIRDENNKDYHLKTSGNIGKTKWVLSFYETPISYKLDNAWLPLINGFASLFVGDTDIKYTTVSDVMILRLKFETDGQVYNLGVVDNKMTGNGESENEREKSAVGKAVSNIGDFFKKIGNWFKKFFNSIPVWAHILIGLGVVIVVIVVVKLIVWIVGKIRGNK